MPCALMNIKIEDLFPFAAQVDSGVAELVRKTRSEMWPTSTLAVKGKQ